MKMVLAGLTILVATVALPAVAATDERIVDVATLAPDQGVVVGSVEIDYKKSKTGVGMFYESMRRSDWTVEIASERQSEGSRFLTGGGITFSVREAAPRAFVRKMKADTYELLAVNNLQTDGSQLRVPVGTHFRVLPGRISYVGRVIVGVQRFGQDVQVSVADERTSDLDALREKYGTSLDAASTDLMAARGASLPPLEAAAPAADTGGATSAQTPSAGQIAVPAAQTLQAAPAEALAQGLLNSSYNVKNAERVAAMSSGQADFESHVTVDGHDYGITGQNAAAFKVAMDQRVKAYRDAIAARGFADLAGQWKTQPNSGCTKLGFEPTETVIEQTGPEFMLSNGQSLRGKLSLRGVVAETAVAVEHSMDPTVLLTGRVDEAGVSLTETRTGCILKLKRP